MKTHKVRPVLIEIKFNSLEEMQGDIILRGNKLYTCEQLNTLQLHKKEINDKVFELILLSLEDEEIKVGEIGLDLRDNTLFEVKRILTNHYESGILSFQKSYCKKVIASTDLFLNLPRPSNEFINKFVELNGDIDKVLVEYELLEEPTTDGDYQKYSEIKLKVAPDNTISIYPVEQNYTREEMYNICRKAMVLGMDLREDQLKGFSDKSENDLLEEYLNDILWN